MSRHLLLLVVAFAPLLAAHAQGGSSVLEALRAPSTEVKITDLPDGLRAVMLGGGDSAPLGNLGMFGLALLGDHPPPSDPRAKLVLSLVGTNLVDPQEFADLLEGRRPRIRAYTFDSAAYFTQPARSESPSDVLPPVFVVSWIEAGRVTQWTPRPEVTKETLTKAFLVPTAPSHEDLTTRAMVKMSSANAAIARYAGDNGGRYPKADTTEAAIRALAPYMGSSGEWASGNPAGGRLIFNTALSGRLRADDLHHLDRPVLWDEKPWPDGGRMVAFVNGGIEYVPAARWAGEVWPGELRLRKAGATKKKTP